MGGARINASVGVGRLQSTRAAAATDKRDADDFIVELCCLWLCSSLCLWQVVALLIADWLIFVLSPSRRSEMGESNSENSNPLTKYRFRSLPSNFLYTQQSITLIFNAQVAYALKMTAIFIEEHRLLAALALQTRARASIDL
jgi:hypothetical protein